MSKLTLKRLYLDICTFCRPFDNQDLARIRLETDAYYLILSNVNIGYYKFIVSPVHLIEASAIPEKQERFEILAMLNKFNDQDTDYNLQLIRQRAEELYKLNFGIADAAHVAYAEVSADILITCDDKLLKKCKKKNVNIEAMTPVEFVMVEDLK